MAFTHPAGPGISAKEAMRRLVEGNRRFVRGAARFPTVCKETLATLARQQRPFATILGCSDSRVPPELLFDASFGELFVIRIAGNTLSPEVAGSLQYAGQHLGTPLFVVLGHEGCGAISAALDTRLHGVRHHRHIAKLVKSISPGLERLDFRIPRQRLLAQAIEANVRSTVARIAASPEGKARLADGQIKLAGAIYELKTGRVRFLR